MKSTGLLSVSSFLEVFAREVSVRSDRSWLPGVFVPSRRSGSCLPPYNSKTSSLRATQRRRDTIVEHQLDCRHDIDILPDNRRRKMRQNITLLSLATRTIAKRQLSKHASEEVCLTAGVAGCRLFHRLVRVSEGGTDGPIGS